MVNFVWRGGVCLSSHKIQFVGFELHPRLVKHADENSYKLQITRLQVTKFSTILQLVNFDHEHFCFYL